MTADFARVEDMALDLNASIGSLFIGYTISLWCVPLPTASAGLEKLTRRGRLYGVTLSQIGLFFHNSSRERSRYQRAIVSRTRRFRTAELTPC